MMAEIYGKETGCSGGKGGSMHLIDLRVGFLGSAPIVGSTIPIGVGASFSSVRLGEGRVTMVFLGDGATETGVFHESLNFAVLHHLPVVFVCENNLYSVYSPMNVRQPQDRSIVEMVRAFGIEGHQADGNDVEVVYQLSKHAVDKARSGGGPTFLEFITYRWREHCGPNFDNDIGYRTAEEYRVWREKDPVERHRKTLLDAGVVLMEELDAFEQELTAQMDEAVAFAKSSPFPSPHLAAENIFAK
jgi:pyruvate dehydrogenase E1 component alpha subunit